jgi:hypothetical protein
MTYIGSTASPLPMRLQQHAFKHEQFTKYEIGNYCGSFKIIEGGDYKIELIEEYPCNSKTELRMRERYWYDLEKSQEGAVLANIILPYRFYADLQEQRRKTDAKRATNPDRIASKKASNHRRYLLRRQLSFYNILE